jgi:hypothetical protein
MPTVTTIRSTRGGPHGGNASKPSNTDPRYSHEPPAQLGCCV